MGFLERVNLAGLRRRVWVMELPREVVFGGLEEG